MAAFKDLINILSTMNKASYSKKVSEIIPILKTMEANPAAKSKFKNDNWLSENVLIILFTASELMTHPKNHLLKKFCLSLHPDRIVLPKFISQEFASSTPSVKKQMTPGKK